MSKGLWIRCPITGLPLNWVPDRNLVGDRFNTAPYPDCDLFDVRSIAGAAGYRDWRNFGDRIITGPHSHFHAHAIRSNNGRVLTWATHTTSAEHGGKMRRAETTAHQVPACMNVSSGGVY